MFCFTEKRTRSIVERENANRNLPSERHIWFKNKKIKTRRTTKVDVNVSPERTTR